MEKFNMNHSKRFIEGKSYTKIQVPDFFVEEQYFKKVNEKYICKVSGISHVDGSNYVFYPKGFNESDFSKQYELQLFKLLKKYSSETLLNEDEAEWLGINNKFVDNLTNIEWIISDYKNNGLYLEENLNIERNGKGNINWAHTIKKEMPIINENTPYYIDFRTKNKKINEDDIVNKIHKEVLQKCIDECGWLFIDEVIITHERLKIKNIEKINVLRKRLNNTFESRKIKLLQSLIAFLEEESDGSVNYNLVTPYFYNVWEEMLKKVLGHMNNLKSLVPKPYWLVSKKKIYTRQIPDILIEKNNNLIIMDAKYYTYYNENISSLPGWESIVKQLYYSLSIGNIGYEKIENIFLFPANNISDWFQYIGLTAIEGLEEKLGIVNAYLIDIQRITDYYLKDMHDDVMIDTLIKDIFTR